MNILVYNCLKTKFAYQLHKKKSVWVDQTSWKDIMTYFRVAKAQEILYVMMCCNEFDPRSLQFDVWTGWVVIRKIQQDVPHRRPCLLHLLRFLLVLFLVTSERTEFARFQLTTLNDKVMRLL